MKAKVITSFYDLKEGCDRAAGEVMELTKTRFNEIEKKIPGYIEAVAETPKAKKAEAEAE